MKGALQLTIMLSRVMEQTKVYSEKNNNNKLEVGPRMKEWGNKFHWNEVFFESFHKITCLVKCKLSV